MKIRDIKEALSLFENAAIEQGKATYIGDHRKANRNYDKIRDVVSYLRKNVALHELSIFYTHSNLSVRSWAASYLLPIDEKRSLQVLKEIANMEVFGSLDAKMTIKEWKNGNLKTFYTL